MYETWKTLNDYPKYEVSDLGRLRRGRYYLSLNSLDKNDYVHVTLSDGARKRRVTIHILVLETFVGPRPDGMVARHLNGCESDNKLSNLAWGTQSQNNLDKRIHGTSWHKDITHCPYGHKYGEPNQVESRKNKGKACLACARAKSYRQKNPNCNFQEIADIKYQIIMSYTGTHSPT